uniref:ARAD1C37268p n=1 Tax=Blastobotrys adeninivorans TaxID=409370 RepID=A0A060T8I2_BLAAD
MAILSKYRKNKKDARNSVMPQGKDSPTSESLRQVSGASATSAVSAASQQSSRGAGAVSPTESPQASPQVVRKTSSQGLNRNPSPYGSIPGQGTPGTIPGTPMGQMPQSPQGQQQQQQHTPQGPGSQTPQGSIQGPQGHQGHQGPQGSPAPGAPAGVRQLSPSHAQFPHQKHPQPAQYPWSQSTISNASPFPRYGHAANPVAARDGEIYVMGGLKGSHVFGDLWVIESDTLVGYLMDTEDGPSPRVGHASLTLGNAYIVFGGDTKIEETDELDDNLYLLNTSTFKWTVTTPVGKRPSGRYGHSISTIGSKVYIFGGQLDDYFFDDLVAYDLTTLRNPDSKWEFIQPNSSSPPPRTNHTIISHQDKLYLFGGTDGKLWYSDTWCYDPQENTWTMLECSGFIPAPCEGHSATIIGDIMYVFGGRSSQGKDIGTLSALKLTTLKWYTFQNLGPGPSPRSGHSMTAFDGHKILVMGGESPDVHSSEGSAETNTVYILDTSRINYPPDSHSMKSPKSQPQLRTPQQQQVPPPQQVPHSQSPVQQPPQQQQQMPQNKLAQRPSNESPRGFGPGAAGMAAAGAAGAGVGAVVGAAAAGARKVSGDVSGRNGPGEAVPAHASPQHVSERDLKTPPFNEEQRAYSATSLTPGVGYERVDVGPSEVSDETDGMSATTFESVENNSFEDVGRSSTPTRGVPSRPSTDTMTPEKRSDTPDVSNIPGAWNDDASNTPKTTDKAVVPEKAIKQEPDADIDQSTPRASQVQQRDLTEQEIHNISQAMERLKASNTWYESELQAAKDAGYIPSSRPPVDVLKFRRVSQRLTQDNEGSLQERDILIAALNELKDELQTVQQNVKHQAEAASVRISEAEKERERVAAENESLRAQLGIGGGVVGGAVAAKGTDRAINGSQAGEQDLHQRVRDLESQLEESKNYRSIFMGSGGDEQSLALMVDELKSNNLDLEKQLRALTDKLVFSEHETSQLKSQMEEMHTRSRDLESTTQEKVDALSTLNIALSAAEARSVEAHRQLEEHRAARTELERKVQELQSHLDMSKADYESSQRQLEEHRSLLEHSNEQSSLTSRALSDNLSKVVTMWSASKSFGGSSGTRSRSIKRNSGSEDGETTIAEDDDYDKGIEAHPQYIALQQQVKDLTQLHVSHKDAADKATDELSQALRDIATLKREVAQNTTTRSSTESELQETLAKLKLAQEELDTHKKSLNDVTTRHAELETKFNDQDATGKSRIAELEAQLEQLEKDHSTKYADLEAEYDKSFQYIKNTETALTKTREELSRYKDLNAKLQTELDEVKLHSKDDDEDTSDRDRVGSPSMSSKYSNRQFELQLRDLRAQIIILQEERDELRANLLEYKKKAINSGHDLQEAQDEIARLTSENESMLQKLQG